MLVVAARGRVRTRHRNGGGRGTRAHLTATRARQNSHAGEHSQLARKEKVLKFRILRCDMSLKNGVKRGNPPRKQLPYFSDSDCLKGKLLHGSLYCQHS